MYFLESGPHRNANGLIRRAIRDIGGTERAAALPKSYDGTTTDIVKALRETARRHGVRLTRIHVDGPKEEVSVETRSGTRVLARFDKQAWIAHRIVKGSVVVSRGGVVESSTPYEGLARLESLLNRFLRP